VLWEKSWAGGWAAFHAGVARRFGGRLCCDCWRPDGTHGRTRENMYYARKGVRLAYSFAYGERGIAQGGGATSWRTNCSGQLGGGGCRAQSQNLLIFSPYRLG